MSGSGPSMPNAQEVLDAIPSLAMVLDADHHVVMSNSWFAANAGDEPGTCAVACYERVHGTHQPHPDCPLIECAKTNRLTTRELVDDANGRLSVTVAPFKGRTCGERLFLHLTQVG